MAEPFDPLVNLQNQETVHDVEVLDPTELDDEDFAKKVEATLSQHMSGEAALKLRKMICRSRGAIYVKSSQFVTPPQTTHLFGLYSRVMFPYSMPVAGGYPQQYAMSPFAMTPKQYGMQLQMLQIFQQLLSILAMSLPMINTSSPTWMFDHITSERLRPVVDTSQEGPSRSDPLRIYQHTDGAGDRNTELEILLNELLDKRGLVGSAEE
ncbi:hypothetical protein M5689_006535 [Euphorbia peplus]|nr:hypothetical protein M5689_006535 [Euphorbia peplus]